MRRGGLRPVSGSPRQSELRRRTRPKRTAISPASPAQREKVRELDCIVCGVFMPTPAHLAARGQGGCDDALCVVPLCAGCHRKFDERGIDLVPYLERGYRAELAHAVEHLGLIAALHRLTGQRWTPIGGGPA